MKRCSDGACAICGESETAKSPIDGAVKRLAVDHDHRTGQVRGLLCSTCNNGLGCFKDNIQLMKRAIDYLDYHNSCEAERRGG